MPDTPRSLATVLSLFADNTVGAVSQQDLRDFVVSLTSPIGGGGFDQIGQRGVYDVRAYGADPTGVAGSSTAIQAAIDACATAGGGIVYVPPGRYLLTATLNIDEANGTGYQNIILQGAGSQASVLAFTGGMKAIFWGTSRGVSASLLAPKAMGGICNLQLDGPNSTSAGSIGIHAMEASYYEFRDIFIQDCESGFVFDTGNSFTTGATIMKCRTTSTKFGYTFDDVAAVGTPGECTDMRLYSCYANPGGGGLAGSVGFWLKRVNTSKFFACSCEAFDDGYRLGISGTGGSTGRNEFVSCRAENIIVNEGVIYDGVDNWMFGGTIFWNDTTNSQQNQLIGGKYNVAGDAATPDFEPRQIRPITAAKLPAASASVRGEIFYRPGNAGTKDQLVMCMKAANNSYSWVDLSL